MRKNLFRSLLPVALLCGHALAQLPSYDHCRSVLPVDSTGYYRLPISSEVLYRAQSPYIFRVYKLAGNDTTEVPYVLTDDLLPFIPNSQQEVSAQEDLKVINSSYEPHKASYYTIVADTGLVYTHLQFGFEEQNYDKEISLEGCDDLLHWKVIVDKDRILKYWKSESDHFERATIYFPEQRYRYFRLVIHDDHSERIHLSYARVSYRRHVPYASAYETVPCTVSRREDKVHHQTLIEYHFTRPYLLAGARVKVKHDLPFFRRSVHLSYSMRNQATKKNEWVLMHDDDLVSDANNYIVLGGAMNNGETATAALQLAIDNRDDQPLREVDLELFTPTETMILRLEKGPQYLLAYGKTNDAAPVYDISYFKQQLPRQPGEARLGPEQQIRHKTAPKEVKQPLFSSNWWIWGLMILSILLVGGFTASLMRQSKHDRSA